MYFNSNRPSLTDTDFIIPQAPVASMAVAATVRALSKQGVWISWQCPGREGVAVRTELVHLQCDREVDSGPSRDGWPPCVTVAQGRWDYQGYLQDKDIKVAKVTDEVNQEYEDNELTRWPGSTFSPAQVPTSPLCQPAMPCFPPRGNARLSGAFFSSKTVPSARVPWQIKVISSLPSSSSPCRYLLLL